MTPSAFRILSLCTLLFVVGCPISDKETGDTSDTTDTDTDTDTDTTDTDSGEVDATPPTVVSTTPYDAETDVAVNRTVEVLFDEPLDPATVTIDTFTLMAGGVPLEGTVSFSGNTATFTPTANLPLSNVFDALVTTGVTDLAGNALAADHAWRFTSGAAVDSTAPLLLSTNPFDGETHVGMSRSVNAYFSEPLDPATVSGDTFSVMVGTDLVFGTVTLDGAIATFTPAIPLDEGTRYDATLGGGIRDLAGNAVADDHAWSFTTGTSGAPGFPVDLRSAGDFAILAKTGISSVPGSTITGNIGVSPAAATYITGFSLTADATNVFSTTPQVVGMVYAADYAPPTPSNLTTAVGDMMGAFTDAAGRAPDYTELGEGEIGGMTLAPGVYKWGTGVLIATDVTLNGSATDVWIFQIAQDLTVSSATNIYLTGGAVPENVFWQVSGRVEIGTTAHVEGIVLTQTAATLGTGASIDGRLLAQTAVTLDASTVTEPAR
jgi:hypothetical protein